MVASLSIPVEDVESGGDEQKNLFSFGIDSPEVIWVLNNAANVKSILDEIRKTAVGVKVVNSDDQLTFQLPTYIRYYSMSEIGMIDDKEQNYRGWEFRQALNKLELGDVFDQIAPFFVYSDTPREYRFLNPGIEL